MQKKYLRCFGPITLSALSLFLSFIVLQPLALFFGPTFNLLASRGIGKVAFVSMAIYQILLFLSLFPIKTLKKFFDRTLFFFVKEKWFPRFALYFSSFFTMHSLIIAYLYFSGILTYNPNWGSITTYLVAKTAFGLFVVFMLAWTEELIFRGTLFPYFNQFYGIVSSLFITSLIFMLVHNLRNPLLLITRDFKLGLGLFLLGLFLNQIFVITGKLYTGMGVHAGLVFVKVIFRRAPFLTNLPDLRSSHTTHILFLIAIVYLFVRYRRSFSKQIFKTIA